METAVAYPSKIGKAGSRIPGAKPIEADTRKNFGDPLGEGITKFAVGTVISDNKGRILLLKRKADGFLGSRYELPGGLLEHGESLKDAIVREVKEETGLIVTNVIDSICDFDFTSRRGIRMRRFGFIAQAEGAVMINNELHESYAWVPKKFLNWIGVTDNSRRVLEAFLETSGI